MALILRQCAFFSKMKRLVLTICVLFIGGSASFGQSQNELLLQIKNSRPDTNSINLQLQLADYFLRSEIKLQGNLTVPVHLQKKPLKLHDSYIKPTWKIRRFAL